MTTNPGQPVTRGRQSEEGLQDRLPSPCMADALDLLVMADALTTANPHLARHFEGLRDRAKGMLAEPMQDDLATEWQLEALAMDFRRQWIILANSIVAGEMKSPRSDRLSLLPVSPARRFLYERVLGSDHIEEKLKQAGPEIPGWRLEVALFSSGMAAITATIIVLHYLKGKYQRADGSALRLDMFGGYFETLTLLELLRSSELHCRSFQDQDAVLDRFRSGKTDVLFLELIAYDWVQSVVDPGRLLEALEARPVDRPWILIVDTTLLGPMCHLGPLLAGCGARMPVLVIDLRSGLKLEQSGLEFSNIGIVKILTPEGLDEERYPNAAAFKQTLSYKRKLLGSGLSLSQIAVLDAPWIFHPELTKRHNLSVLDNNRRLALALAGIHGLFARVNHPVLGPDRELDWAQSPIVVMEFHDHEDCKENREFLLAVIAHEARKRKLVLYQGASFGFRHHRCEVVVPKGPYCHANGNFRGFFKVAMGSRRGPSLEGTIALLCELAAFPDFKSLHSAYPKIDPKRELAAFPDPQALRLRQQVYGVSE